MYGDGTSKEVCIQKFVPLVKRIAYHLMAKLPASVQVDDVIQTGMIGLLDAMNRYEESLGARFETYAVQRIRGAMLDGLREADWLPRSLRKDMRRIESAITQLEQKKGRVPTESELAGNLEIALPEYRKMLQDARGYQLVYFEDFQEGEDEHFLDRHVFDEDANPLSTLLDKNTRQVLVKAIDELPERERFVMGLYYEEELNLREIGQVLGVSESRVCQLHSQAISRLRSRFNPEDGTMAPLRESRRNQRSRGFVPKADPQAVKQNGTLLQKR